MRGYSLMELLVVIFIFSLLLYLAVPSATARGEREAIYQELLRAKWTSVLGGRKVKVKCEGNIFKGVDRVRLKLCTVSCNRMVFHPSGYVTPAGSLMLQCGAQTWKLVVSALGRVRIFKLGAQKAVGDEEDK